MTFDDDLLVLQFSTGPTRIPCKALGIEWPPPEHLKVRGLCFRRLRMSEMSDEQRAGTSHVCRGAEYSLLPKKREPNT